MLKALSHLNVDYFSLDIEGAEYVVLKTLPWNKANITLLSIETNHAGDIFPGTRQDIQDLLQSHNYEFKATVEIDDFYLHKNFKKSKTSKNKTKKKVEL